MNNHGGSILIIASLYEIKHRLGSGGSGVIYLGRHLRLEKNVVLKADKCSFLENVMTTAKREADTLKNLSHTYIPQIYDFVSENGIIYTVMDYIEGESLDKALERGEVFTSRQVVRWALQVTEALVYLHNRPPYGILHSDIKPANIMLKPEGDICLIDFNIALALGEDGAISVGRSLGYASPEHYGAEHPMNDVPQVQDSPEASNAAALSSIETIVPDDREIISFRKDSQQSANLKTPVSAGSTKKNTVLDARSDIYGLGATLYHLLTGCRPERNAAQVVPLAIEDGPPGLIAIINKAMSPNRDLRFQSAGDMHAALVNIHTNDPRARRHRRLCTIVAALLTVLLAIGFLSTFIGLDLRSWGNTVKAYTEASGAALMKGDKPSAARQALNAVLAKGAFFTPPVPASAQKALADALGIYDLSEGFKLHQAISLPSAPLMADMSQNGKTAAIVYAYETAVVDLESGRVILTLPMAQSALAEARFLNDTTLVYAGPGSLYAYNIATGGELWRSGAPATAIAVCAHGITIAAVNGADSFAMLYDINGNNIAKIDFGGKSRRVARNDTFANPRDNLFALSAGGRYLAVSFADGSLSVFDAVNNEILIDIEFGHTSGHIRYEGGFYGDMLAFSATNAQRSDFIVIDIESGEQMGGFSSAGRFGVIADESGIFISSENLVVKLDPVSGVQQGLGRADSDVHGFAVADGHTLVALENSYAFFDQRGRQASGFDQDYPMDITLLSGGFALVGGRDSSQMSVLWLQRQDEAQIFAFDDMAYHFYEARLSADGSRIMLFSVNGFRIYDSGGVLIHEQEIPNPELIYDQQHSGESGNLAVMYDDALLIYDGHDGQLIFEETGLRSVFYAPYGVSILDNEGLLRLICLDGGMPVLSETIGADEMFAAYCGMIVDSSFLAGRKLIGAAKTAGGYRFVVSDGHMGTMYDGSGTARFDFPTGYPAEAFFTGTAVIISPMHGVPAVYSQRNGRKIAYLEADAYLTYITEADGFIVSQYLSTDGEQFGMLLNSSFQPAASLPRLCDIWNGQLVFNCPQGALRVSSVYTLEEMIELAKAFLVP